MDTQHGLLVGGAFIAFAVIFCGLGAGLLLLARDAARVEKCATAGRDRGTATILLGAGVALTSLVAMGISTHLQTQAGSFLWLCAIVPLFVVGFTADSLRTGRKLTGRDGASALTIGWLVRAGALALPLVWPLVAAYLLVSALGNPLAALFAGNSTTASSAGSSPER